MSKKKNANFYKETNNEDTDSITGETKKKTLS